MNETCKECGRESERDEMVCFAGEWVCSGCKATYLQKLKEGVGGISTGGQLGIKAVCPQCDQRLSRRLFIDIKVDCTDCSATLRLRNGNLMYWLYWIAFMSIMVLTIFIVAKTSTVSGSLDSSSRRSEMVADGLVMLCTAAMYIFSWLTAYPWISSYTFEPDESEKQHQ